MMNGYYGDEYGKENQMGYSMKSIMRGLGRWMAEKFSRCKHMMNEAVLNAGLEDESAERDGMT
jgi:hypothetical protein